MKEIKIVSMFSNENKTSPFSLDIDHFKIISYSSNIASQKVTFNEGSIYLYVQEGFVNFKDKASSFEIGAGYYLSKKCPVTLTFSKESIIFIVQTPVHFVCLNTFGGPIEDEGRLKYIDGCSDTLLICPVKLGGPCLNFLHFPKKTQQTMHSHPSFRCGMVTIGSGWSISANKKSKLSKGDVFFIPSFYNHKFDTDEDVMNIVTFHPDSDWGPTDEVHPMINRTWVNGKKI